MCFVHTLPPIHQSLDIEIAASAAPVLHAAPVKAQLSPPNQTTERDTLMEIG